jgi:uncharacterized OsmC-like protein
MLTSLLMKGDILWLDTESSDSLRAFHLSCSDHKVKMAPESLLLRYVFPDSTPACQDSSVRMVANLLGITLESLEVEVTGDVDVRGTLAMNAEVPVGFRVIRCAVRLKAREGTDPRLLEKLRIASERSCVVQQTLLHPPRVETTFDTTGGGPQAPSKLSSP